MYQSILSSIKITTIAAAVGLACVTAAQAFPPHRAAVPQQQEAQPVRPLNEADRREISFITRAHVAAMSSRNADILYRLAAPEIRSKFQDAGHMLKVYSVLQGPFTIAKDMRMDGLSVKNPQEPIQYAYITDRKGRLWWAALLVKKAADGTWHVRNCLIVPAPGIIS